MVATYPEGPLDHGYGDPAQMLMTEPVARSLSPPRVSVSRQSSPRVNGPPRFVTPTKGPVESSFRMVWPVQPSPPASQQRMARSLSPVHQRGIAFTPGFNCTGGEEWGDRGRSPRTSPKRERV